MGPKKRVTAAERQQRATTTAPAIAKKRAASGSASSSPASRKATATPKKNIIRTPTPAKKEQLNKEKEKWNDKEKDKDKDKDKQLEKAEECEGKKIAKRTPSRENVRKSAGSETKKELAVVSKLENTEESQKPETSKAKADTLEKKDEKTKAISKMLKNLDIKISGFDNLLPREERITDGLKSSISENVKTKSRAAAVKVIASLNPPKSNLTKKARTTEDEKKAQAQMPAQKEEMTKVEANKTNQEIKETKEETKETKADKTEETYNQMKDKETEVKVVEIKKKTVTKKAKTESTQKGKKPANKSQEDKKVVAEKIEEGKAMPEVDTPTKKRAAKSKAGGKIVEEKNIELKEQENKVDEEKPNIITETADTINIEKVQEKCEKSPRKTPSPKKAKAKMEKCNIKALGLEEKEETLKVVLDANTEVVQMDIEEMSAPQCNEIPETVVLRDATEQATTAMVTEEAAVGEKEIVDSENAIENEDKAKNKNIDEKKPTMDLKQRLQNKYKVTPINSRIAKTTTKAKITPKATVKKLKDDKKSGPKITDANESKKDIYDFKSGSEEEENIKMELPTLKNLREFSDDDNKPLKTAKESKETKDTTIVEVKEKNQEKAESFYKPSDPKEEQSCEEKTGELEESKESVKETGDKKGQDNNSDDDSADAEKIDVKTNKKPSAKTKVVCKVYKRKPLPAKKVLKVVKAKPKTKLSKKHIESSSEGSDSEDEKKLIVFGQKRHRMASLNALAKVQCLYENESRTAYELGLSKATQLPPKIRTVDVSEDEKDKERDKEKEKDGDEKPKVKKEKKANESLKQEVSDKEDSSGGPEVETKREQRHVQGGRGVGKHWEFDSDSENDEIEKLRAKKKKLQKKLQAKKEREQEKEKEKEREKEKNIDKKDQFEADDNKEDKSKETPKEKENAIKVKRKYTKVKKPLKKIVKLKTISSGEDCNSESSELEDNEKDKEQERDKDKLNKVNKLEAKKPPKKRKRMLREELIGDYKGILARKRMASLNASAIVAATYEVERHLDKNLDSDCSSYESYDESEKPSKKAKESAKTLAAKDAKRFQSISHNTATEEISTRDQAPASCATTSANAKDTTATNANTSTTTTTKASLNVLNEESNDSKYSKETKETNTDTTTTAGFRDSGGSTKDAKESSRPTSSSVVIVQDTDVTITGVYVNATTGSSQEAYCKMQYRVQSSVTEERVLRPSSVEPPKSYTPLSALSSMLPPGAGAGAMGEGLAHASPPPPQQTSVGSALTDPLNAAAVAGMYHASDLGLHAEHGAPEHGPPPPSYAAAAAAAAAAYHAHHMSPAAAAAHHQHPYHTHHQYQQATEHVMHAAHAAHGPLPPHHYQSYGPPPTSHVAPPPSSGAPVQGRCDVGSPPPTYRPSVYASPTQQQQQLPAPPHSTLSMSVGGGTSAFCAPNMHHHQQLQHQHQQQQQQQHQQQQSQLQQHDASGYYQPAGPLISPHVLPPVAAAPPPPPPNVPHLPAGASSKKQQQQQQIPAPLSSDPEHLQQPPQSTSTADSTDSDVLITGGDLTPFRYPTTQSHSGVPTALHQQQQPQHHPVPHQQQPLLLAAAAAAHQGSPYPRSMHAPMHYSTAYPPSYYTPYPGEAMCYSPPAYQPYFPTKVYQSAPPPPPPTAYRRYPYYQPGPPPPPPSDLYEQAHAPPPHPSSAGGAQQAGPQAPPTQAQQPPAGSQLVPAGPGAHTQHLEHYPGPPGYYSGYSPGPGGAAGQCYTRSIQAPYMEYPPQCPCPMQQSCPKNVHTGPHIGSNSSNNNSSSSNSNNSINNNNTALTNNSNITKNQSNNTTLNQNNNNNNNNNNSSSSNMITNGNIKKSSNTFSIGSSNISNHSSLASVNISSSNKSNSIGNNNNNSDVLTTSRGPVKNLTTMHQQQQQQQQQQQHQHDISSMELQQHLLQQQQQQQQHHHHLQHCNLELLQNVKSELKTEDSDSKSQYEENVVQPPTPPESYGTNDDKLLDTLEQETVIAIQLEEDMEEAIDKLQATGNSAAQHATGNIVIPAIEAYDLTNAATPPLATTAANNCQSSGNSNNVNANVSSSNTNNLQSGNSNNVNSNSNQAPFVARKARIGKTMAREMVYAGTAQAAGAPGLPPQATIHVRTLPQQHAAAAMTPNVTNAYVPTPTATSKLTPQVPLSSAASQTQNVAHTHKNVASNISASATTEPVPPFLLKSEIKAEKIKVEDDFLDAMLQQHAAQELSDKPDLKLIKTEPLALTDSIADLATQPQSIDLIEAAASKPVARMRLLPCWQQQPPTIDCDIELSSDSEDDVLDLCHSPVTTISSASAKRIKILEFHKSVSQCKKSPPNSYKSLIKQAQPRTYLCVSRKFDKRSRYGKLPRKCAKAGGGSSNMRRRQLILTEQQKALLQVRKKKLMALERRKQEATDKKKAAVKQKRLAEKQQAARECGLQSPRFSAKQEAGAALQMLAAAEPTAASTECVGAATAMPPAPAQPEVTSTPKQRKLLANATEEHSPKCSPKRSKPTKKAAATLSLHLLETIDAVARGYFSEPETRRSASAAIIVKDNEAEIDAEAKASAEAEARKLKKSAKASSAEKRSKSETKKPIKAAAATALNARAPLSEASATGGAHTHKLQAAAVGVAPMRTTTTSAQFDKSELAARTTTQAEQPVRAPAAHEAKLHIDSGAAQTAAVTDTLAAATADKPKRAAKSKRATKTKGRARVRTGGKRVRKAKAKTAAQPVDDNATTMPPEAVEPIGAANLAAELNSAQPQLLLREANNNEYVKSTPLELAEATAAASTECHTPTSTVNNVPQLQELADAHDELHAALAVPTVQNHHQQQQQQQQQQPQQSVHSDMQMFLQPAPPVPRIACHHAAKRTRSRSKFGSRKRQKVKHSTVSFELDDTLPPATRGDVVPKWNNGWTWEGEPFQGAVFLNSDDHLVIRTCYPAMRHAEGDIIRTRDCVLLKANEDNELPYVAKVAHLWENPEDGEMMMSLLWYYRPEHTEQGRQHNDSSDEVYASRHRDHNSVACIEDKCYVLTFSEYCRYRRRLRAAEDDIEDVTIVPKRPNCYSIRTVPDNTNPELVMFCRRAYEFRTKRLLKMPNKQDYYVVTA